MTKTLRKIVGTSPCDWDQLIDNRKWYKPWTWRKRYPNYYFVDGETGEVIDMDKQAEEVIEIMKKSMTSCKEY